MKRTITFLIFLCSLISLKASDFELMPTNIHFIGSVAAGKNLIAYGDFGSYLMTTDKGASWKQYSLHEFGVIQAMVNQNDTLWGIIDEGYILRSLDYGRSWTKRKYNLDSGEYFVYLLVTDKNLFVRTTESIRRYDKDFNFLNSIKDSLLKIYYYGFNFKTGAKPFNFGRKELYKFNDQIIASTSVYWNGFLTLPEELTKFDTVNVSNKIHYNVDYPNTRYFWLNNILEYKGKYVFNINDNLYYTDNNFSKFTYFYPDTTFLNANDTLYYNKWLYPEYINTTYYFRGDDLFMSYYREKNGKLMYGSAGITMRGGGILGLYGIKKYSYDGDSSHFKPYNNYFDNKYYTPSSSSNWGDYGAVNAVYTEPNTILEDTIIAKAGKYKTLLQTRDDAKNWELITSLNGMPKFILNDSTYIFQNDEPNTNDIYRTTDYGHTFMPTEIGLDTAWTFIRQMDSLGNIDTLDKRIDTVTHFGRFEKTSVLYMDSIGRSFWAGPLTFITEYDYNCAYSNDFGKKYKFAYFKNLFVGDPSYWESISSNIELIDGRYVFSVSNPSRKWRDRFWNYTYMVAANMKDSLKIKNDSLAVIHYMLIDNLKNFRILATTQDVDNIYSFRTEIRETNDSGKTYKSINLIDEWMTFDQFYEHNKDSLFFTTIKPARLFLYDRKRNAFDLLYQSKSVDSVKIMLLSGKFYLLGNHLFMENTDRNDLTKWADSKWDYGTPSFESVIFKGNVAIAKLYDDVRPKNYYRIMLESKEPVSVIENLNSSGMNFKITPNPATDYIEINIPVGVQLAVHKALEIYSIEGILMQSTSPQPSPFSERAIHVDVSGFMPGVYFVKIGNQVSKFIKI